jgi:hypothetical protein
MKHLLIFSLILVATLLLVVPAHAQSLDIENPISGTSDFGDVIDLIADNLVTIAIPIGVLMYLWAGVLYITAGANPGNISKAKSIMLYTTIGLVIIFIGSGFVTLIESFISP